MRRINWTPQEVDFLLAEIEKRTPYAKIASLMGTQFKRTFTSDMVRNRVYILGKSQKKEPKKLPTVEEQVEEHKLQKQLRSKTKREKQLADEVERLQREQTTWFVLDEHKTNYKLQKTKADHREMTAFILAGDWHVEEEIKPESVNHLNEFNLEVADSRITHFFNNSVVLLKQKASITELSGVVFVIGGDLISGSIHEELLASALLEPMDAMLWVEERLIAGLKLLRDEAKKLGLEVTVVGKVGNHTRITKKVYHSHEQGNALEWMSYHHIMREVEGLKWVLDRSYLTYLDVYDFKIRIHHGHAVGFGGGVGGITIPMNKANANWDEGIKAHLSICFHWHQQIFAGKTIINGSLCGYSPFAVKIKAKYEPPRQKFFLFTDKGEVTGEEVIFLD